MEALRHTDLNQRFPSVVSFDGLEKRQNSFRQRSHCFLFAEPVHRRGQ